MSTGTSCCSVSMLTLRRREDPRGWVRVICLVCMSDWAPGIPAHGPLLLPAGCSYHDTRLALLEDGRGVKHHYMKLWRRCLQLDSLCSNKEQRLVNFSFTEAGLLEYLSLLQLPNSRSQMNHTCCFNGRNVAFVIEITLSLWHTVTHQIFTHISNIIACCITT